MEYKSIRMIYHAIFLLEKWDDMEYKSIRMIWSIKV